MGIHKTMRYRVILLGFSLFVFFIASSVVSTQSNIFNQRALQIRISCRQIVTDATVYHYQPKELTFPQEGRIYLQVRFLRQEVNKEF